MKCLVISPAAVQRRPGNRGSQCEYQEAKDLYIVIRGVTAAVGKDRDGLRQAQDVLRCPRNRLVPQEFNPVGNFFRVRDAAKRKREKVQNKVAEGEAEAEPQSRIPTGRRFYCRRGNSGLKLRIMRYSHLRLHLGSP